jgi:two-component system response regulator
MENKLNVLLIDDNPEDVRFARETLEESGQLGHLDVIADGEEAMEYLDNLSAEGMPDVILLDLYLPKKSGLEIMRVIKNDPKFKSTPIVLVTASTADEDFIRQFGLPAAACVQKPFDKAELRRVNELLSSEEAAA